MDTPLTQLARATVRHAVHAVTRPLVTLDAIGEAVGRWRVRGKCATCLHFAPTIGRADDLADPGMDGHCTTMDSDLYGMPVYRRTSCAQHEAVTR